MAHWDGCCSDTSSATFSLKRTYTLPPAHDTPLRHAGVFLRSHTTFSTDHWWIIHGLPANGLIPAWRNVPAAKHILPQSYIHSLAAHSVVADVYTSTVTFAIGHIHIVVLRRDRK